MNGDLLGYYPRSLSEQELIALEEKIQSKIKLTFSAKDGDFVPKSSQKHAIIKDLWEYVTGNSLYTYYNPSEYGVEIIETGHEVLKYYSPDKGDFIGYFHIAITNKFKSLQGREKYDEAHQTTGLSKRKIVAMGKAVKKLYEQNIEPTADLIIEMSKDEGVLVDYYDAMTYRTSDIRIDKPIDNDSENNADFMDILLKDFNSPDKTIANKEQIDDILYTIESAFQKTNPKQRGYLSEAITAHLSKAISEGIKENESIKATLNAVSWFVPDVFAVYEMTEKRVEQKIIAQKYGINVVSLSRAIKEFKDKVKKEILQ